MPFEQAAHARYPRGNFNKDELPFAQALDAFGRGVWLRNADTGDLGYNIPLPFKVGDSLRFFPDFLWWPDGLDAPAWAIDTTGRHLIREKIRGKLVAVGQPRMALVVRGHADLTREQTIGNDGWSAVIARSGQQPLVEHAEDLPRSLSCLPVTSDASGSFRAGYATASRGRHEHPRRALCIPSESSSCRLLRSTSSSKLNWTQIRK